MRVRDAIAAECDAQGVSLRELARRLDWPHTKVQRRMAGDNHISVTDLDAIAQALDVEAAELLAGGE